LDAIEPSAGRVTRYTTADGLPDDTIRDVQRCGERCVWVVTAGGVGHWDGARWKAYASRDGLPSDNVRGVSFVYLRDGYDTWAATASGILVGTPRGAAEWNGHAWQPIAAAAVNDASGTAIATDGGLWLWEGDAWRQANDERITLVAESGWYATPGQVCRWVDSSSVYHVQSVFAGCRDVAANSPEGFGAGACAERA